MSDASPGRVRLAIGIVVAWLLLELLLRWGVVGIVYEVTGALVAADWTMLLIGFPVMAGILTIMALRAGQTTDTWDYRWTPQALAIGVVGALLTFAAMTATAELDAWLFGLDELQADAEDLTSEALESTPLLAIVFLLGNGIAVPIAEEHVWRGIVQTELVARWGVALGIGVTALLFTLKHVIVDLSIARLTTLLVLSLAFGLARHYGGTGSSIVLHIGTNLTASGLVVAESL